TGVRLPVHRPLRAGALPPRPARVAPEFASAITTGLDEGGELAVGDRRAGDAEGGHLDAMRPLLIVEDEAFGRRGAELPRPARHVDVAGQGTGARERPLIERSRRPIAEGLARVGQRLDMHVL